MPKLFSQMEAVSHRFEELSIRLNQPETAADPALFRRLMQEYHELEPVVDTYRKLATAKDHLEQAKALLEGETLDADFKEMVQQEVSEKSQDVAELENNLKILLLPKDANDEKSVILELRGGAGGEEAALFAHSPYRLLQAPGNSPCRFLPYQESYLYCDSSEGAVCLPVLLLCFPEGGYCQYVLLSYNPTEKFRRQLLAKA